MLCTGIRSLATIDPALPALLRIGMTPKRTMAAKNIDEILHPKIEPFKTGMLEVSKLHTVYWEISGNPKGKPVIVLHGGPGGASQAEYRRYFDPESFQIVQMDQRGCGKSTPHAELEDNNSQALIEDIEKLRKFLGNFIILDSNQNDFMGNLFRS